MKRALLGGALAVLAVPAAAGVVRMQDVPATPGASDKFTGSVTVRALASPTPPARTAVGLVTFAPDARTFWHTHPAGQTFVVTDGCGLTQEERGAARRVCKGDVVTVAPGVRHWHGASPTSAMAHVAVSEAIDGRNVDWKEAVADADYRAAAKSVGR